MVEDDLPHSMGDSVDALRAYRVLGRVQWNEDRVALESSHEDFLSHVVGVQFARLLKLRRPWGRA